MGLEPWFEKYAYIVKREDVSPSHTVGSERSYTQFVNAYFMLLPSHAVGLEHVFEDGGLALVLREGSSSHTAGLEQSRRTNPVPPFDFVSIPHGGLGTGGVGHGDL